MQYKEFHKDIFTVPPTFVLAHCISADAEMGKGIADLFRLRFPKMKSYLIARDPVVGQAIPYTSKDTSQIIVNLVTKEIYKGKPTYHTLTKSLKNLRMYMDKNGLTRLAIPKIGCGLDRLDWKIVKQIIHEEFEDSDIKIAVCFYK